MAFTIFAKVIRLERPMFRTIISLMIGMAVLGGCTSHAPEIHTLCLRDGIGNYLIKWETNPPIEGQVKVFVSDNPEKFNKRAPVLEENINQGVTTFITNDNITRKYFQLVFNDKYSQIVGARSVALDSIQNLRDMGGYFNNRNKMTRWGKVYRSGDISHLSLLDSLRLSKLGIKTIIDMRNPQEIAQSPINLPHTQIVPVPLAMGSMDDLLPHLQSGRMRKGDAIVYMQDFYLQFITHNKEAFAEAMQVFLEKDNYPILFNCTLGKDGTGFLAAMLLAALSVPEETIMQDYLASNDYIFPNRYAPFARNLNSDAQEAITVLLSANESFINPILINIKKEYGSTENFIESVLHLTEKDQDKLKDILLY